MLKASTRPTASPRRHGAPAGAGLSLTSTDSPTSTVKHESGFVTSTANTPLGARPVVIRNAGLERGGVPQRRQHFVGLDRRSESEWQCDVALVDPRVPQRVLGEEANRHVTGRRFGKRRPTAGVEVLDCAEESVIG